MQGRSYFYIGYITKTASAVVITPIGAWLTLKELLGLAQRLVHLPGQGRVRYYMTI